MSWCIAFFVERGCRLRILLALSVWRLLSFWGGVVENDVTVYGSVLECVTVAASRCHGLQSQH